MNSHTPQRQAARLAFVVPCFNGVEGLPTTAARLRDLLSRLKSERLAADDSYICFVDDGSRDRTWHVIAGLVAAHPDITGLKLARNVGHQGAVLAGLCECAGDATVTIDADLQDDEGVIRDMMLKLAEGYDVVLGVRHDRTSDTWSKRFFAETYYRLLTAMGVKTVFNHADYRLLSRRATAALCEFPETNLFLRGLVTLIGFKWTTVEYARRERVLGESKYPVRKMLSLAWEGITSFS
ncbi:MAG: glycosyltransferase family 2 protein, partial [Hyphomicrobiaceae bacterium]